MSNKYIVKEDMICPITKEHCDDECCPVGSECNLSAAGSQSSLPGDKELCDFASKISLDAAFGSQVSAEVKEEEDEIPDLPPAHKMSKGKRTVYSTTPKEEKEEWISVEERLPELKPLNPGRNSSDPVLVLTTSNDHFICELEELISTGERWWIIREVDEDVDRYSASKVTHWIYLSHLPAPPKQAEQNDKP